MTKSAVAKPEPKPVNAFMQPPQPNERLRAVVSEKELQQRRQAIKEAWEHIKKNNPQVSMFEMTKLINQHLAK